MVTKEDVVWCYNTFLVRQPESDDVVSLWMSQCKDFKELVRGFSEAPEFQQMAAIKSFARNDAIMYHKTKYGFLFPIHMNDAAMYRTYVATSYEEPETDFIRRNIGPGDHVVDIGVRHGWFACHMAQIVGEEGRVFCYDPDPICSEHVGLCSSINEFSNIFYESCALGNSPGELMFDPSDATLQTQGSSKFGLVRVPIKALDDLMKDRIKKISFIKIDVEGAEQMVFDGASDILDRDKPTILMEINDSLSRRVSQVPVIDTVRTLRNYGYSCTDLSNQPISDTEIESAIDRNEIINVAFFGSSNH
ncbi:FkbM family methyltransferase [Burkholderia latens]|uniref:FkbM family methyltransferase n=1 Tax=Burkholderia latens TaxID=488446 RepID=UPI001AE4A960|nr:FkbM family methyltransferase [Burkholderia latens]QTO46306.1 FkbM family methyltransferase [Burkholderia latens]